MIQQMLTGLGYRVHAESSSGHALDTFRQDPESFDLVLTDQTMPGMTGATLAKELLRLRPDLPIVLCTGYSEAIDEGTARAMGIRAFLYKPLTRATLAQSVRTALDHAEDGS